MTAHLSLVDSEAAAPAPDAGGVADAAADAVRGAETMTLPRLAALIVCGLLAWLPVAAALLFIVLGHRPIPNT